MIVALYQLEVISEKRTEFLQSVPKILKLAEQQPGCVYNHIGQDLCDADKFFVVQAWKGQTDLDNHLRSDGFGTFMGSIHLLRQEPHFQFYTVSSVASAGAISRAKNSSET